MLKVTFRYDDKGQRMEKINYQTGLHTWYINDAGGQVVRIYEAPQPPTGGVPPAAGWDGLTPPVGGWGAVETPLYGMSRVGIWQQTYDKMQPNGYTTTQGVAFADYIYEAKDHLGNVRVTYRGNNEQAEQTYQTMDLEHENAQSWEQDHNDLRNFSNSNAWRSYQQAHDGKFSLKISPVPQQPQPQPQKVAQFRLPVRKGERWTATVWAKWGMKNESPPAPEGGVRSPQLKSPQRGVKSPPAPKGGVTSLRKTPLWGGGLLGLAVSTPLFLPQGENQGLSFNVLAAVPLAVQLTKSLRLAKSQRLSKFGHNLSGGSQPPDRSDFKPETPPFVTESVEAYLLVELLNEKGEVINPAYRKYFVTSQGDFEQIGNANEETIDFGDECTQTGFLRFSLVNEHDQQPAYFDAFEIVHKPNTEKLTVTSWTDYYPFGKVAKTACSGAGAYRYGYQGEFAEKDGETDWNSFELRQYDSDVARWLSVDPYYQHFSPYLSMGNNPVSNVDANGGFWQEFGNWLSGKGWMSHEAYAFSQANTDASYEWIGSRFSGYGEFTQGYSEGEGSGVLATRFQAINDFGNNAAFESFAGIAANQISFWNYVGQLDPQETTRIMADAMTDAFAFTPLWWLGAAKAGYGAWTGRNPVREFMGSTDANNQEDKIDQFAGNYPGTVTGVYETYGLVHRPVRLYGETSSVAKGVTTFGYVGGGIGVSKTLFDGFADKENNPYEGIFWQSRYNAFKNVFNAAFTPTY